MTVYISEHSGAVAQGRWSVGPPLVAPYSMSSASTPRIPNTAAGFIRVSADVRAFMAWTVSTISTAAVLTSTNYQFIVPANAPAERFPVPVGLSSTGGSYRLAVASTTT